jgi:hypothetical protein
MISKNIKKSACFSRNWREQVLSQSADAPTKRRSSNVAFRPTQVSLQPDVGPFRDQHLALATQVIATESGHANVVINEAESPLVWLARRRGRDGRPLIQPHQLQAGNRLRADFTRAHLMPRTTSNWTNPIPSKRDNGNWDCASHYTETMIAARQSVHQALDAVGPEFAGLLLDVCCFLKHLEDVERERQWPVRSAKIVLQLALDRLARHYGYAAEITGRACTQARSWHAEDAEGELSADRSGVS